MNLESNRSQIKKQKKREKIKEKKNFLNFLTTSKKYNKKKENVNKLLVIKWGVEGGGNGKEGEWKWKKNYS